MSNNYEPFKVDAGTSSVSTILKLKNAAGDTTITEGSSVPLGSTVYDTATLTVTPSPAPFVPTGTVTYEFFSTIDCTGPHPHDEVLPLNANGTVPNSST